jgi:hypothetical protein
MEVSGQLHASAIIPWGKTPLQYPLNRKLGGSQSQSGRLGEKENRLILLKSEPWIVQPVA